MDMNKHILLGIDTDLSPPTQYALRVVSEFLAQSSPDVRLLLLHVIPIPSDTRPVWGKTLAAPRPFPPTTEERLRAERALQCACKILQQRGIVPERIELLRCVGAPADELVRVARERQVDFIVLGSRGNSFAQRLRRVVAGSTSRRVLRLAPCPIMVTVPPGMPSPKNLVAWYKEAVTRSLSEHPGPLKVFTACDAAQVFAPPNSTVGKREVEAAARALEELAGNGVLCRHRVKGEVRYLND
jgi:nucleotide-binding universal stress UspA family protein